MEHIIFGVVRVFSHRRGREHGGLLGRVLASRLGRRAVRAWSVATISLVSASAQVIPLLTTAEAAARLGLSPHTIRKWAKSGRLPGVWLTKRSLRFRVEDVEALIDTHERLRERERVEHAEAAA